MSEMCPTCGGTLEYRREGWGPVGEGPRRDMKFWGCPKCDAKAATAQPDAGDVEALGREMRRRVLESSLYDDDAMPYVVGEDATDEQNERQDNLIQWVIDRAAEAAEYAAHDLLGATADREAQLRLSWDLLRRDAERGEITPRQVANRCELALATPPSQAAQRVQAFGAQGDRSDGQ